MKIKENQIIFNAETLDVGLYYMIIILTDSK